MTTKILSFLLACAGVQALAAAQLWNVSNEVRTDRLFAEARQPQAECTTLDEYQGNAPDRGHMQYPVSHIRNFSLAAGDALGRPTQLTYPVSAASARA
jgi:DNA/RNA endonuclease G (NUC1)